MRGPDIRLAAWRDDHRFARYVALFNHGEYFTAHEVLEELWLRITGEERDLLQGLIQLAVALEHHVRNNPRGAVKVLGSAERRLAPYGERYAGIPIAALMARTRAFLAGEGKARLARPRFPSALSKATSARKDDRKEKTLMGKRGSKRAQGRPRVQTGQQLDTKTPGKSAGDGAGTAKRASANSAAAGREQPAVGARKPPSRRASGRNAPAPKTKSPSRKGARAAPGPKTAAGKPRAPKARVGGDRAGLKPDPVEIRQARTRAGPAPMTAAGKPQALKSPAGRARAGFKRGSIALRQTRARALLDALRQHYPDARCELAHGSALELLAATILSAQCTDVRVNMTTPALFARYPDARSYAQADPEELGGIIKSTGFYRNKTRSLIALGKALVEKHGGEVPAAMESLVALPGVGRKTANVLLTEWFGRPGIAVDTHVIRLTGPVWRLTDETDPVKIEFALYDLIPEEQRSFFGIATIFHGRRVCSARKPNCAGCSLSAICPTAFAHSGVRETVRRSERG